MTYIQDRKKVSAPGAAVEVTELQLSEEGKKALNIQPPAKLAALVSKDLKKDGETYMRRRGLRLGRVGAYIHQFTTDDPRDAYHCHPWAGISLILWGGYREHRPSGDVRDIPPLFSGGNFLALALSLALFTFFLGPAVVSYLHFIVGGTILGLLLRSVNFIPTYKFHRVELNRDPWMSPFGWSPLGEERPCWTLLFFIRSKTRSWGFIPAGAFVAAEDGFSKGLRLVPKES